MGHIEIVDLNFTYPSRTKLTLQKVSAQIEEGEFILLTGPTGCGKSTLLRTLNGLIPHASGGTLSGHIHINGTNLGNQPLAVTCQQVGLLFQNPDDQLFCAVVEDEIAFGLENLGIAPREIDEQIDAALTHVGLPEFRHRSITTLSGGEKQRVALACLCAMKPRVLLLDEPTSHLDPLGARDILEILQRLNREDGMTVLIATHHVSEVAPLCNRVWLMSDGELILDSHRDQAFSHLALYRQLGVQLPEPAAPSEQLEEAVQLFQATDKSANQPMPEPTSSCFRFGVSPRPLVSVQNLTFRYPRTTDYSVRDVSFEVKHGEVVVIMGANGSGKTTLLLLIAGLLRSSAGRVIIDGENRKRWKLQHLAGKVGIVFQNPDLLLQADTLSDEVAFGPRNLKLPGKEIQTRLDKILASFDLVNLREESPHALSRGQRQRTAIASTFSLHPTLLLLDEPTTGQDFQHLQQSMRVLCKDVISQNRTLICCTHNMQLALRHAERILLLRRGELIFDGAPGDAFADADLLQQASLIPPSATQLGQVLKGKPIK